jgi:hypothetical protein
MCRILSIVLFLVLACGAGEAAAPEPPVAEPLPTYDRPGRPFPTAEDVLPADLNYFRPIQFFLFLSVDADELEAVLNRVGFSVFQFPWDEPGTASVFPFWNFRSTIQYPNPESTPAMDPSVNHGPFSSFFLGCYAVNSADPTEVRLLWLADVRPTASAVDRANTVLGGGLATVSHGGKIEITLKSTEDIGREREMRLQAKVDDPVSGLKLVLNARLPEGVPSVRQVRDPYSTTFVYTDLSAGTMGRSSRYADQFDLQWYSSEGTPGFRMEISTRELRLPGGAVLKILGYLPQLALRSNLEAHEKLLD